MSKDVKSDLTMELLTGAFSYAKEHGHTVIQPAHLLIAMMKDKEAEIFFDNIGIDTSKLREAVERMEEDFNESLKVQFAQSAIIEIGPQGPSVATGEHATANLKMASKVAHANKKEWASYVEILAVLGQMGDAFCIQAIQGMSGISAKQVNEAIMSPKSKWSPHKPVVPSGTKAFNSIDEGEMALGLADTLKEKVFDQDDAIDALHSSMKVAAAGLKEEDKPRGSYLFAGPTGVGKTEVAKQLQKAKGVKLLRIDMSEFMEEHSVSRLIGSPPGYVGHGEEGVLDQLEDNPDAIVLFDEIEKAHPKVYNALLQIMDNGRLTKGDGTEIDFKETTIIMTSNVGARDAEAEMDKNTIGFNPERNDNKEQSSRAAYDTAIKSHFTPEFRNRLDGIVVFDKLSRETVHKVTRKFIMELNELPGPQDNKLEIIASDEAIAALAEKGFDDKLGARPLKRAIHKMIKEPLSDLILADKLRDSLVTVEYNPEKDSFFLTDTPIIGQEHTVELPEPANENKLEKMIEEDYPEYQKKDEDDGPSGGGTPDMPEDNSPQYAMP